MDTSDKCCTTHLIHGDGTFNVSGLENFTEEMELTEPGLSHAFVSIMGPQSSGKSTLLNHLFHTNFKEMDASKGRLQTTTGIWMARSVGIEPCTILMDLEGTDGTERGEDDTAFEKQSALFALFVSDIMLINMWCHDIGREKAANMPLLRTVFQAMIQLLDPLKTTFPRKKTLMFVIRDKSRTPLEKLEETLREDIHKIWDNVSKPEALKETPLSGFFNVEVVALSNYEEKEEQFQEQVACLRKRLIHCIAPGGFAGDRRGDASGFAFKMQEIWNTIKENKNLNLPALSVMVARVKCEEIANEKLGSFVVSKDWCLLKEDVQSHFVAGSGKKLSMLLEATLFNYNAAATYFDEGVRSEKYNQLKEKLLQLVKPTHNLLLGHLRSGTFERFKVAFDEALGTRKGFAVTARECTQLFLSQFDEGCADTTIEQVDWDSLKVRDELEQDINVHIDAVCSALVIELIKGCERELNEALSGPTEALLVGKVDNTWQAIRNLLRDKTKTAISRLSAALSGYEIDEETENELLSWLEDYAREVVEAKARKEAGRVLSRMKDRFWALTIYRINPDPSDIWTARIACLKLLAVMAVLRLDDGVDNIQDRLISAIMNPKSTDLLSSNAWDEIRESNTLITPVECGTLWREFLIATDSIVLPNIVDEGERRNCNWILPMCICIYIIMASLFLGVVLLILVFLLRGYITPRSEVNPQLATHRRKH